MMKPISQLFFAIFFASLGLTTYAQAFMSLEEFKAMVNQQKPTFIGQRNNANGDPIKLEIKLLRVDSDHNGHITGIKVNHEPWTQPSMYNDKSPNESYCDISTFFLQPLQPREKDDWYVICESDDYALIPYLKFRMIDSQTLELLPTDFFDTSNNSLESGLLISPPYNLRKRPAISSLDPSRRSTKKAKY